ncbi:VWA domain-containing protein [Alicyclobacillus sp. SP_1]|uniref:VWA domain-containing protein n=1 Tax=Alicyclobacillus sp. SP_1 TaxID=2942475 RepID=UPI00215725E4|nr:VWA domain-containing protein [Alicyclobacillus sp. SP_1]
MAHFRLNWNSLADTSRQMWRPLLSRRRLLWGSLDARIDKLIAMDRRNATHRRSDNGEPNMPELSESEWMRWKESEREANHHLEDDEIDRSLQRSMANAGSDETPATGETEKRGGPANADCSGPSRESRTSVEKPASIDPVRTEIARELAELEVTSLDSVLETMFSRHLAETARGQDLPRAKTPRSDAWSNFGKAREMDRWTDGQIEQQKRELKWWIRDFTSREIQRLPSTQGARRKYVDARRSIRSMALHGGVFERFYYRPGKALSEEPVRLQNVVCLGDVSGSMGKYVATVLFLLNVLTDVADVDNYVFSDTPTHLGPLPADESFRHQYERLRRSASSWEYGTNLGEALAEMIADGVFDQNTVFLLITDGGFQLSQSAWQQTVTSLRTISETVKRIVVATPNPALVEEAAACAEDLPEALREEGDALLTPWLQKVARFGLLADTSDSIVLCQSPDALPPLLEALLREDPARTVTAP